MTENNLNRFTYGSNERWEDVLIDNLEKKEYDLYSIDSLCNRLWEQTQRFEDHNKRLMEENEQLKSKHYWYKQYKELLNENEQLKIDLGIAEDNHKLDKEIIDDIHNEFQKVKKENEQLKQTLNELANYDKEKDIEIEHINNIYKEFGFKGIINYARDKLQGYGLVREVDNGLWLLATGGWSDNEFWLDCLLNWNFMYAKGHYRATTSGGGYYYTETPYEDIEIKKRQIKG